MNRVNEWKRVCIWLMLLASLAFNYMLYQDNRFMSTRYALMEEAFDKDFLGYDYCWYLLDLEEVPKRDYD